MKNRPLSEQSVRDFALPKGSPSFLQLATEVRVVGEAAFVPAALSRSFIKNSLNSIKNKGGKRDKTPVVLFPAFGIDKAPFLALRQHMRNLGHPVACWGLGRNRAGENYASESDVDISTLSAEEASETNVRLLIDKACEQVEKIYAEHQRPVVLLGWSLGGYVAREVSRVLPEKVCHIITMGSPIVGGAKYTVFAPMYSSKGLDLDMMEQRILSRHVEKMPVRVTAIFSKSDGMVDWRATIDKVNESTEHWEVSCSHTGFPYDPKVWEIVEHSLASKCQ